MNAALYAGTDACWTAIEQAAADGPGELLVLVVMGPELVAGTGLEGDLSMVADILVDRVGGRVRAAMAARDATAGRVFDVPAEASAPRVHVVGSATNTGLQDALARHEVRHLWAARTALDVLAAAGLGVADVAAAAHVRLTTL